MRALIVVESTFGNTRAVADAVARGLASSMQVEVVNVEGAPKAPETDLLIVGGPTHAHGMTRPSTRKGGVGIREWIATLPAGSRHRTATFDTRFDKPSWLVGSAARGAAHGLRRKGFRPIVAPESFYVVDAKGPLADGELARARTWGAYLAAQVSPKQQQGAA